MPSRLLEPRSSFTEMWLQKPLLDSSSCGWRGPGPSLCGPTSISFVCTRTKHSSLIEDYNCKRACKCTRAYTRRSSVFVAKVGGRRARIRPGLPRTTRLRNISDDSGDSARIAYRRASKAALTRFFCFFFFFPVFSSSTRSSLCRVPVLVSLRRRPSISLFSCTAQPRFLQELVRLRSESILSYPARNQAIDAAMLTRFYRLP